MTLILLPNLLGETRQWPLHLPASVETAVHSLDGLIAESDSGARRFLSLFGKEKLIVALYNKNSPADIVDFLLEPVRKGEKWGLLSDAGLPCIADPGHLVVARARTLGLKVEAHSGPSSIFLALMLSGLPGQNFHFHGYADREPIQMLKKLPSGTTHLFIEAPHRSNEFLKLLVDNLPDDAQLSVSWDLTLSTQNTLTHRVSMFKKMPLPNLTKKPAIFCIYK